MRRIAEMSYEELIEERKELEKFIIKWKYDVKNKC